MHAAVVTSFDEPPSYQEFRIPTPQGADEVLVDARAVPLADVAMVWQDADDAARVVLTP